MAVATSPSKAAFRVLTPMESYLLSIGGKDVLTYDTDALATDAVRTLRARHPEITVSCSYNRVYLEARLT